MYIILTAIKSSRQSNLPLAIKAQQIGSIIFEVLILFSGQNAVFAVW